ncbi:MAG: 5-carboxymethyl-2-hydroxymuconate Delta-isomerase [Gammaproteobacteria bacterium]|nr:5-carboxymethyl-2-hydroxymuconate Delta-isomerase [Gammaproteobacteria bacterium]
MPHVIVEYAQGLLPEAQIRPMLSAVHDAVQATALFKPGHIKVRAWPVAHYLVGGEAQGFVHAQLRIKPGRNAEQKKQLSSAVLAALKIHLPGAVVTTVEVIDMDASSYAKHSLNE